MTEVRPFRALRYDPERVELGKVIVPPYDVVADDERAGFYERDPHNAIRLELVRDAADEADTDYSEVRTTLEAWRAEGVLLRDAGPGLYALRQTFTAPDGSRLSREGFFAELRLADYSERVVRPHERTMAGPKADRLKQLRAARANLSPIFLLYEDRAQELAAVLKRALDGPSAVRAVDEAGTEQVLARVTDEAEVDRIRGFLAERPTVIADGHHRYETALAYRDERRAAEGEAARPDAPYEFTLAFFANLYAPGSLLLPIHRVIRKRAVPTSAGWRERLSGWREETHRVASPDAIPALLDRHLAPRSGHPAFAADDGGDTLRIFWRDEPLGEELMVRVLEREVLLGVFDLDDRALRDGAVSFPKSAARAAREVREGDGALALYLNPLDPDDVFRVTAAGDVMPQKSTFFYPKLPSGLVFRLCEDE